jgi:glutaminyl-peptide cyclotransferase
MKKFKIILSFICLSLILSGAQCTETNENIGANGENINTENGNIETMNKPVEISPEVALKQSSYEVINIYPHDNKAFTQGLIYYNGFLYEGTGLNGESSLRKVELETGKVLQKYDLAQEYFGEGITIWNNKIIQLTWQSQKGFIYDLETFEKLGEFSYPTEGWGLTHDDQYLIMSDGSDRLYFLDPETFKEVKQVRVHYNNRSIIRINELEYINGEIFANVWLTDKIIRINPDTGEVNGFYDLQNLTANEPNLRDNVLNGIAYNPETNHLFVTGKLWSNLYEIKLNY